jgi:RNA polymerase sigma-70 factor, ECF subfamily
MLTNELELYQKVQKGNLEAFDKLFLKYYQPLCRFSFAIQKNEQAAEDIVQDLFVYLWENRQTVNITTSVKAFLYTSVRNRTLNYIKSSGTRRNWESTHVDLNFEETTDEVVAETNETFELIEQAINELPEKCKEIFILNRKYNLKYNDIAKKLNLSPKTVENQIGIALKRIREYLSKYIEITVLLSLLANWF